MNRIKLKLHYTTATILAIIAAGFTVATTFGLDVSKPGQQAILTLAGLVLGGIVIGGGVKSAAMLNAGIHPMQIAAEKAARKRAAEALAPLVPMRGIVTTTEGEPLTAAGWNADLADAASKVTFGRVAEDVPQGGMLTVTLEGHRRGRGETPHPVLQAHGTFKGLALGKREPKTDARTPVLGEFMTAGASLSRKLPATTHRLDPLAALLGGDFGMMGNDVHGDCTCAALGHALQVWTGADGVAPVTLTAAQILDLYWKTGNPSTPGADDNGRVMFEVLKYAHHNGFSGHELGAYVSVGLRRFKHRDVKAAIDLFGGCYLGVALPETAQSQSTWDVAGDPSKPGPAQAGSWGGHAIWLGDYDRVGPTCITWGHPLKMTWAFLDAYADEGYAVIGPDWLSGGKTIEGIDLAGLTKYLAQIKSGYQPPQ